MSVSRELMIAGGGVLIAGAALLSAALNLPTPSAESEARAQLVSLTPEDLLPTDVAKATGPLHASTANGPRSNPWNPQQGIATAIAVEDPPPPPLPLPMAPFIPTGDGR